MGSTDPGPSGPVTLDEAELLDALPVTLVVFDDVGTITYASTRWARLFRPRSEIGVDSHTESVVGRNVMEFVHPDDLGFATELMDFGNDLDNQLLGPIRLRYVADAGDVRYTEVWAENRLSHPGIGGHVVVLTEETTMHRFTEAITRVAAGADAIAATRSVASAMSGFPMCGTGVVLERLADGTVEARSNTPFDDADIGEIGRAWEQLCTPEVGNHLTADFASPLSKTSLDLRFPAVWSIDVASPERDLLMLCWRPRTGEPSPNQVYHLLQATAVLQIAFTQETQRLQLEHLAYHDALTGLYNRGFLYDEVANGKLEGSAVLFVDIDGFKPVNDQHGHDIGDQLLRRIAKIMTSTVREDDIVARIGGDEFVVVCAPPVTSGDLQQIADRLIADIGTIHSVAGRSISVGASVGIVHHHIDHDFTGLLQEADAALYLAKESGGSRWWMAPIE